MKRTFSLLTGFLLVVACSRNSLVLPNPKIEPIRYKASVVQNNVPVFEIILEQNITAKQDSVTVFVKNLSAFSLDSASFLLEICQKGKAGFDGCTLYPYISFDRLNTNEKRKVFTFSNHLKRIDSDSFVINIGLLSLNKTSHPLGGIYNGYNSYCQLYADTQIIASALVNAYVLMDGETVIRIKNKEIGADISGKLDSRYYIEGKLFTNLTDFESQIENSDSMQIDEKGLYRLSLKLLNPFSEKNIDSLSLHLEK